MLEDLSVTEIKGNRMWGHTPPSGPSIHRDAEMESLSREETGAPGSWVQQKGHEKPLAASPASPSPAPWG